SHCTECAQRAYTSEHGPAVGSVRDGANDSYRVVGEIVHDPGGFHVDSKRAGGSKCGALAGPYVARRRHERSGVDAETRTAELGGQYWRGSDTERTLRLGAPQLACDDEVAHLQLGLESPRNPDQSKGRQRIEPRGQIGTGTASTVRPGTDDDVCTADGAGFDAKRRQNLEISRETLRSRSVPAPSLGTRSDTGGS